MAKRLRANFDGANFKNATLTGGDSSGAKFMNANLSGANLSGRNFSGATFSGAIYDTNTTWPNGFDPVAAGAILNHSPTDLNTTSVFSINENQPIGTVIGEFNATDPDAKHLSSISGNGNGSNQNYSISLSTPTAPSKPPPLLITKPMPRLLITVQAKDELNATTEGNFSISLLNIIEDFDQDGIEDHYDPMMTMTVLLILRKSPMGLIRETQIRLPMLLHKLLSEVHSPISLMQMEYFTSGMWRIKQISFE